MYLVDFEYEGELFFVFVGKQHNAYTMRPNNVCCLYATFALDDLMRVAYDV